MARRFGSATTSKTEVMPVYTADGIYLSRHVFRRTPDLGIHQRAGCVGVPKQWENPSSSVRTNSDWP